ncbi:MAG TPA: hypothetical protein VMW41_03530 [Candidatus Bathyarchaeia archaeon]|nr:hypothetical protein [Candidatus Bathyarchaeia archaeon]
MKQQIFKYKYLILCCLLLLVMWPAERAAAQVGTLPTNQNESPEPTKDPISEQIRKEVQEKIKAETEPLQDKKKAFFGEVTDLFNQTIVLQTFQGKRTATVDSETLIVDQNKKKLVFEDLEIGSFIITMGYSDTPEKLLTKRVVIADKPKQENRIAVIGQITQIEKTGFILQTLQRNEEWQVNWSKNSQIVQKVNEKNETIGKEMLEENDLVVVTGLINDEKIEAKLVFLLTTKEISPTPEEKAID